MILAKQTAPPRATMYTMKTMSKIIKKLRWRLTFSYTLVTLGALLLAEIALIGALLISVQYVRRSNVLPVSMVRYLQTQADESIADYLTAQPVDQANLQRWVDNFIGTSALGGQLFEGSPTLPWQVLVLDEQQMVLASTSSDDPALQQGAMLDLDAAGMSNLQAPLAAALRGAEEAPDLTAFEPDTNTMTVAVPVFDDAGQVAGVIAVIATVPQAFQAYLPPLLAISGIALLAFGIPVALAGATFGFLTARGLVKRLERLADATGAWSQGDFTATVADESPDELGELTRRMNRMAEQLHYLVETRQEFATVEERNRIARDLHDSAKQQAYAVAAQLGTARLLYEADPTSAEKHLVEAEKLVNDLRKELTGLIRKLRPVALQGQGLAPSLEQFIEEWSAQNEIQVDYRVRGERAITYEVERTFFRIAQEALANIARHSEAAHVVITLAYTPTSVAMNIADDGKGFVPSQIKTGVGLRSMRERAGLLGGTLTVMSAPGKGALIAVKCPYEPEPLPGGSGIFQRPEIVNK